MNVAFFLSMPSCPSWNGKWSGEGRKYVLVRTMKNEKATTIINNGPYYYNWSDGWGACISVMEVDPKQSVRLKKGSDGFCGYDWMVNTICDYGQPMDDEQVKSFLRTKVCQD